MRFLIEKMNRKCCSIKTALVVLSLGVFCLSSAVQNTYFYKGYFYKHPFFENKSLYTAQSMVIIETPEKLLNAKFKSITYTGISAKTFGAYLSGDSLFVFTTDLVQDFCYNVIEYSEPKFISLISIGIDSNTAIYAIKNGAADVFRLCVSGKGGRINLYSIDQSSLSVQSSDSIILKNAAGGIISSINGASSNYNSVDSVLWITGSNGLLRSVRLGQNSIGEESSFDIAATENVRCFGDGIAGTDNGSVYERKGAAFEKVFSVNGTIRSVNGRALAGDGVICAKNFLGWTKVKEGSSVRYRECVVSANSFGSLYELIDDNWNVDSIAGTNTSTQIVSVLPVKISSYLNSQNKYKYGGEIPETVTVNLSDYEKNFEPLSITLKSNTGSIEIGSKSGSDELNNRDPSGDCRIGDVSFADSSIRIVMLPQKVTIIASAIAGREDLICMQCALKPYQIKNETVWYQYDELVIRSATQTLTIVNSSAATTALKGKNRNTCRKATVYSGLYVSLIDIPADCDIMDVRAFDLAGKKIKTDQTGDVIKLNQTGSRVVTLQLRLVNGKIVTIRTILTHR
jgi:hypothetical protein